MKKSSSKLNVVALICTIVMLISCFLPWAEVESSASFMGQSSSFYSSTSGIQSGVGFIALILAVICMVMVFLRSKFMIIPGILNLLFSFFQGTAMEDMSSNVTTKYGTGYAGPSYGIYILILSCLIYVISCIISLIRSKKKLTQPATDISQALEQQIIQSTESISVSEIKPEFQTHENISQSTSAVSPSSIFPFKKNNFSGYQKGLIITGVIIGVYALIVVWVNTSSEKSKEERSQRENYEKERIERIIEKVNQAISDKQYELALINANTIQWMADNDDNQMSHYNNIKSDFVNTINQLIKENKEAIAEEQRVKSEEIATQQAYLKAIANETDDGNEPPSFPFEMVVASNKTYLYAEPDANSDRVDFLTKDAIVTVMANQYDFMFCKYHVNDGKKISGWIYYKDITRINE